MAAKKRAAKGLFATALGAIGFGSMSALGFTPGTDFDGIDGSTIRDVVTGAITVGSVFLPQLAPVANIVKSLSNHRDVEKVTEETGTQNDRLAKLERRVKALESTVAQWEDDS